jgi:putative redox protein
VKSAALLRWSGEGLRFDGGAPGGPHAVVDGAGKTGPSPVTMLLVSIAACTASDVVDIARKMRVAIRTLELDVEADRADEHPRRLLRANLGFRVVGGVAGDELKLQHAIDLSHEKYCSVLHSLREDVVVTTSLAFEPA